MSPPKSVKVALPFIIGLSLLAGYIGTHPVPAVLMFHSIDGDPPPDSPEVSPARLNGFLDRINRSDRITLTTDSSSSMIYSEFYPALRARGLTAIVFVLPLVVGTEDALTWAQVREMEQAGFTTGSHGLTHPWLPDLTEEEIACELCRSKTLIEQKLGHPITDLAYPYGAFNQRIQEIARRCGYIRAYVTAPGRRFSDQDPLAIKRVYVNEATVRNPVLAWLAVSDFYVTTRELVLALLPIDVPRKPQDWSYEDWRQASGAACRRG
jgi:peptidoglycan/xylan/chitin deacetylase (PgdA/CDA1 family)